MLSLWIHDRPALVVPVDSLINGSFVRWLYLLARSLPMTFLLVGWPVIIVYVINASASAATASAVVVIQICFVLALQVLGTVRASQSWAARLNKVLRDKATLLDPIPTGMRHELMTFTP